MLFYFYIKRRLKLMNDTNITIRLDSDLKAWIKEYAYLNRTTISDVVRALIEELKNKEN